MSSDSHDAKKTNGTQFKKRRLQNACDTCRKRKVKCDSCNMPNNICTNCIVSQLKCTHDEPLRKRGPKSVYVDRLEKRLKEMEDFINKLPPDVKKPADMWSSPISLSRDYSPSTDSEDSPDDLQHIDLSEQFDKLEISPVRDRFFGPSSSFMLIRNALKAKADYLGERPRVAAPRELWGLPPWEAASASFSCPSYQFPPADLMDSLISIYFDDVNFLWPALHEPTFRISLAAGLHFHDNFFGALVLAVCATASRYSDDPRVFVDGHTELSAGWIWYDQIQTVPKSMFDPPNLHELQLCVVSCLYLEGTSAPHTVWTTICLGLRLCQELGLHRRKPRGYQMTLDDEMKKRCFWVLLTLDNFECSFSGRLVSLREEDYDAELPADCDDEYCDNANPELMFKQPPGKPSLIAFVIACHKLTELLGFALRTLYSIKKSKLMLGLVGPEWEQRIVSSLDSALNNWTDVVPDHLRWDPHIENEKFFQQSVVLYCCYYTVRIQIHRPFIQRVSSQGASSFAMCANAARACSHVLDAAMKRGTPVNTTGMMAALISGIILMIAVFKARRDGGPDAGVSQNLADANICLRYLRMSERRWRVGGRGAFLLQELLSAMDSFPLDSPLSRSRKRSHEEIEPADILAPSDASETGGTSSSTTIEQLSLEELLSLSMHDAAGIPNMSQDLSMGWSDVPPVFDGHGWDSYVSDMLSGSYMVTE